MNTIKTDQEIEVYTNEIYSLVDDYAEQNPNIDLYNNRAITGLFNYIYNNYIGFLLDNRSHKSSNRYNDIRLIDSLFNIYIDICYKYNNIPTILEFSLFTGISRDIINDWRNNNRRGLTPEYVHTAKKWYQTCELAQVKEKDVKSIFLLKANYNYNDNLQQIPLENQGVKLTYDKLPTLGKPHEIAENDD